MTGNPDVLKTLSTILGAERTANMMYRQDWRSVKALGANKTAKVIKSFGHDTHKFMSKLTDQILMYDGDPSTEIGATSESPSLTATLKAELAFEMSIVKLCEQGIVTCLKVVDNDTRDLLDHILKWHTRGEKRHNTGHVWWLQQQLDILSKVNEWEYILEMA